MIRTHVLTGATLVALVISPLLAAGATPPVATGPVMNTMGTPLATRGVVPTQAYLQHFGLLYEGEYKDALDAFRSDLSSAIKTSQSRWIDSICYYTMVGESYYRLGRLGDALDNYNAALRVYLLFPDWMLQIQFPPIVSSSPNPPQIPWGASTRGVKLSRLPGNMLIAQGSLYIDQQLVQGGVVAPAQLSPVNVVEINRCMLLALKRRLELMGPVCRHDQLTVDLLATFQRHPGPRNHWSEAFVDAELGMALAGAGETGQALAMLKRSLTLGGEYDHPLTPIAMLELGQLAAEAGDFSSASRFFEEASYSAVAYDDWTTLEESFRYGALVHLMASRPGIFPPLAKAVPWARTRGHELYASLLLSLAESQALLGESAAATAVLGDAKTAIAHREMNQCEIGSRFNYLTALVHYQKGAVAAGDDALAAALAFQRFGSKWLFQIWLADHYVVDASGPRLGAHRALELYEDLLRDPSGADWAARPLETLAVLSTPHPLVYEHWFEVTLQSGVELSLEVADRARRHRFLSTLPLGGRLLALRWILEAPSDTLDPRAQVQRQDLLARYPKYGDYAKQVHQLQEDLKAAPLAPVAIDAQRKQADKLAEIARLSQLQEVLLREIAVRREASDLMFPPLRRAKDIQAALPDRHLLLVFFSTVHNTYAVLLSKERYAIWKIESPPALEKRVVALLRGLGNFDANRELTQSQLMDDSWRLAARDATDTLLAGSKVNLYENIDELIVVPDGMLWYLPFETLQVAPKGKEKSPKDMVSLISRSRIRYVPTLGLAYPDRRDRKQMAEVGVVLGKLHPRDAADLAQTEFDRLHKAVPHAAAIKGPLPAASPLYGGLFDRLVVFDEISTNEKGFYEWSPLPLDRARGAGTLAQWFALPWKSPAEIILPGFHTSAENSLKSAVGPGAIGSEMFLSVCGLMSTGARTVLISRWRTGGQTSYELVRQFVQELPYASADDAWQRSVQLQLDTPLDLDREPRVRPANNGEAPTAKNPFFWAGYMLVDTGWSPPSAEAAPPPVIRLPAAAGGAAPPLPMPPAGAALAPLNLKGKKPAVAVKN